ncbi:hypothetical protein [Methylorubrum extorquens]|uniref:Uncharacterized protein n=1 Tax=Methylorubrum extorquens TaxID=408 RepID=A0AAX3WMC3_METEX|nr:hypothetical protein [Methylorubrum extorquens]WHQ71974.1 hypothetical protein KEC54_10710 [Methylorubrum extorquens]
MTRRLNDADFRDRLFDHLSKVVGLSREEFEAKGDWQPPSLGMEGSAARMIRATGCGLPRERKAPAGELPAVGSFWG